MGTADWRNSLQRRWLVRHHLGRRQQQSPPPCPLHLPRRLQNPHETNLVIPSSSISSVKGCVEQITTTCSLCLIPIVWINHPPCLLLMSRQGKPRNRPSFRQILLHLDIASADVLGAPQETYFKSQVCASWKKTQLCYTTLSTAAEPLSEVHLICRLVVHQKDHWDYQVTALLPYLK